MFEKRQALGRGLESLLPSKNSNTAALAVPVRTNDGVQEIAVELIDRNPYQPRRHMDPVALGELAASITSSGVVQPIVVRPGEGGRFQLIAGERRWLASQQAGKKTVPALVRTVSNEQAMEMTIVENLQREDLNPLEHARAYEHLGREFGLTQEQMAQRTGKDRASVANYLRLLKLPPEVQVEVETGALSFGHAKVLMSLDSPEAIINVSKRVIEKALSVRQTEDLVFAMKNPIERERPQRQVDPNVRHAQQELERALGVRVEIKDRKGRGKIVIEYATLEDFDRVVGALSS
jgi:ParB family transcriptional regulator, chromosome partitioning protein